MTRYRVQHFGHREFEFSFVIVEFGQRDPLKLHWHLGRAVLHVAVST